MKTTLLRTLLAAMPCLPAATLQATVLYTSDNFADLSDWTITATGAANTSVQTGVAPVTGSDTSSLRLHSPTVNTDNPNATYPDRLATTLDFGAYTGSAPLTVSFDFKFAWVMNPDTPDVTATNYFYFGVKDSGGTNAIAATAGRYSGGSASQRYNFGEPLAGYLNPGDSWYRVTITLPELLVGGEATLTVTGLDGATIHAPDAPFGPIPSITITSTIAPGMADYSQFFFNATTSWNGNFALDAHLANLNVTAVPEPASAASLAGLLTIGCAVFARRRRSA